MASQRFVTDLEWQGLQRIAAARSPRLYAGAIEARRQRDGVMLEVVRWETEIVGTYPLQSEINTAISDEDRQGKLRQQLSIIERIDAIESRLDAANL